MAEQNGQPNGHENGFQQEQGEDFTVLSANVDKRIAQLPTFSGRDADWREWLFVFRAIAPMLSPTFLEHVDRAAASRRVVTAHDVRGRAAADSRILRYLMALKFKGAAGLILRRDAGLQPLEVWRLVNQRYQTMTVTGTMTALQALLNFSFGRNLGEVEARIMEYAKNVNEFEDLSGELVGDSVKRACLLKNLPADLRDYAELNAVAYDSFESLSSWVIAVARHRCAQKGTSDPTPMEVDVVHHQHRAKGKGKGKGYGKDSKGKGKKGYGKSKGGGKSKGKGKSAGKDRQFQGNCRVRSLGPSSPALSGPGAQCHGGR